MVREGVPPPPRPPPPMSFRSGGRKLSFELLSSGLTADDVVDDASPRSLPETSSDGQRHRRRRSRRKQGFQSPPIAEEEPRRDGDAAAPAAAFRLTDLRSVVDKVCQSSDAERSAASCVTHVGVELRKRTVAANGRLLASGDDASSSCGSSARESVAAAAAVADVFDAARRPEANGVLKKLDKDESLDWGKFIQENSNVLGGYLSNTRYPCQECSRAKQNGVAFAGSKVKLMSVKRGEPTLVPPAEATLTGEQYYLSNLDQNIAVIVQTVYCFKCPSGHGNEGAADVLICYCFTRWT